jgi:hypothetical protein
MFKHVLIYLFHLKYLLKEKILTFDLLVDKQR